MRDDATGAGRDTAWCEMQAEMQRRILSMFALPPDAFASDRDQNYREDIFIMRCPARAYNPHCTSDDPCTGATAEQCRWTCDDDFGTHYPCECVCHQQAE